VKPVSVVSGKALPLGRADVDTDQIVPSDALKSISREGFGRFLFAEWREDPAFVLNLPEHAGAAVLLAGPNFGCGSSREHAPWAIQDYGFGAVIAPSFADIFRNNCAKIGLLAVELPPETVEALLTLARTQPDAVVTVDLASGTVSAPGVSATFEMDDFTRRKLLGGLDDIGMTLTHEDDIAAFESRRSDLLPRTVT
jgi:3-isopropylmalate/(R)-2-methylmalate dehydratase small subunit